MYNSIPFSHSNKRQRTRNTTETVLDYNSPSLSVSWCLEPSQPLWILSGLRETFIKRYVVERSNKAEIRREEQSEKAENCLEDLWNEIQLAPPIYFILPTP